MRKFCIAAVLCLSAQLPALATDAPPAPAPKEDASAAPAEQAPGQFDPAKVTGAPPSYPLKSENFKVIEEGKEVVKDGRIVNYTESEDAEVMELEPLTDIFAALEHTPQEFLIEHVNNDLKYSNLMNKPAACRGEIVKLTGTLRYLLEREQQPPAAGITKYWKGQISVGNKNITTFISIEPIPPDIKVGSAVNLFGVFFKRYVYVNDEPGTKGTWSPLVVIRRVERATDFEHAPNNFMFGPVGIALVLVLGGGAAFYWWMRTSSDKRKIARAAVRPIPPAPPTAPPTPPSTPGGGDPNSVSGKAG